MVLEPFVIRISSQQTSGGPILDRHRLWEMAYALWARSEKTVMLSFPRTKFRARESSGGERRARGPRAIHYETTMWLDSWAIWSRGKESGPLKGERVM
jgi:hypothetical protein